ncbi:MAG: hypothetical protein OEZ16_00935 [Chromatiales bacterium]|nr:hypothetical protein [Chromatiales bacterium]
MVNWLILIARLCAVIALCPLSVWADEIWFIFDEDNSHYQNYLDKNNSELRALLPGVTIRNVTSGSATPSAQREERVLIVTLGSEAASQAVHYNYPTLNTLITQRAHERVKAEYSSSISAIYLEQPVDRHMELISVALPERKKITIMVGEDALFYENEVRLAARKYGIDLDVLKVINEEEISALFGSEILKEDTLLLLPDSSVVNRKTIKPLVLGSYRHHIPMVGYSQALVKAGALMSAHTSLDELGNEMRRVIVDYFRTGHLIPAHHVNTFDISVNYQLARALQLSLPEEHELMKKMRRRLQ